MERVSGVDKRGHSVWKTVSAKTKIPDTHVFNKEVEVISCKDPEYIVLPRKWRVRLAKEFPGDGTAPPPPQKRTRTEKKTKAPKPKPAKKQKLTAKREDAADLSSSSSSSGYSSSSSSDTTTPRRHRAHKRRPPRRDEREEVSTGDWPSVRPNLIPGPTPNVLKLEFVSTQEIEKDTINGTLPYTAWQNPPGLSTKWTKLSVAALTNRLCGILEQPCKSIKPAPPMPEPPPPNMEDFNETEEIISDLQDVAGESSDVYHTILWRLLHIDGPSLHHVFESATKPFYIYMSGLFELQIPAITGACLQLLCLIKDPVDQRSWEVPPRRIIAQYIGAIALDKGCDEDKRAMAKFITRNLIVCRIVVRPVEALLPTKEWKRRALIQQQKQAAQRQIAPKQEKVEPKLF
eukprot:TRINITY_DN64235_c0_g5_i1.p1 TRINITY_DN64235_c0_g5~~TRINITY_DN64235_c0_g5_i1.p1  ORF type:complete len:458 (+),score=28.01 TRINITY_DN64235_c0_g5_i1:168-1376(+)